MDGDTKTQTEGAAEKTAGKVQNAIGGAKSGTRSAEEISSWCRCHEAFNAPLGLSFGTWQATLEAQQVIALRSPVLLAAASLTETIRMTSEKNSCVR